MLLQNDKIINRLNRKTNLYNLNENLLILTELGNNINDIVQNEIKNT